MFVCLLVGVCFVCVFVCSILVLLARLLAGLLGLFAPVRSCNRSFAC